MHTELAHLHLTCSRSPLSFVPTLPQADRAGLASLADQAVAAGRRQGAAARPELISRLRQFSGWAMVALGLGLSLARRPVH